MDIRISSEGVFSITRLAELILYLGFQQKHGSVANPLLLGRLTQLRDLGAQYEKSEPPKAARETFSSGTARI
jgi:hypothetical protein